MVNATPPTTLSARTPSKGKGNVHPVTGHEGPERKEGNSSALSLPSVLEGGGWLMPRPLPRYPRGHPVKVRVKLPWKRPRRHRRGVEV